MSLTNSIEKSSSGNYVMTAGKRTRVLSVTSGKGGVGKTTVTTGIALALSQLGHSVLVLDADLGLANVNIMLGFKPNKSIEEVLNGSANLSDVIITHDSGIDVIPATSGVQSITHLDQDQQNILLHAFDSLEKHYDYVLVDTSAGIGSNVQYFNSAAERVIVVVDPEPTSITDAYALMKVLSIEAEVKEFDILINRSKIGDTGTEVFRKLVLTTSKFLNVKLNLLGTVQLDESVPDAIMRQIPLLALYPSTRASRDLVRVAKKIESQGFSQTPRGGLQFFFESMLQASA